MWNDGILLYSQDIDISVQWLEAAEALRRLRFHQRVLGCVLLGRQLLTSDFSESFLNLGKKTFSPRHDFLQPNSGLIILDL